MRGKEKSGKEAAGRLGHVFEKISCTSRSQKRKAGGRERGEERRAGEGRGTGGIGTDKTAGNFR